MTETMSPTEAARVLAEARGYEGALLRRTEGLTWMVWGAVTPGVFVTYAFVSVLAELEGFALGWWMGLLWIPWIAMGMVTTIALWRSVAIAAPALKHDESPWFWIRVILFMAAFSALFWMLEPRGPEIPLMIVGAMWCGMGVLNLWGSDASARVVAVVAGAPLLLAGAAFALLSAPIEISGTGAMVLSAASPFLVGAWRAFRG